MTGALAPCRTVVWVPPEGAGTPPSRAKDLWDLSLLGFEGGERSRLAAWERRPADADDFLFDPGKRREVKRRFLERLEAGGGPFAVVAQGFGAVVAYAALGEMEAGPASVPLFLTAGSPLSLPGVRLVLGLAEPGPLPPPASVGRWLDLDAADLRTDPRARRELGAALDTSLFQRVAPVLLVRELARALEDAADARVPVLVELSGSHPGGLDRSRERVLEAIGAVSAAGPGGLRLRLLRRYVAVDLTRHESEILAEKLSGPSASGESGDGASPVTRLWRNGAKRALLVESARTLQVPPPRAEWEAEGQGIRWAVLDTGVDAGHPHFSRHRTIAEEVDCLGSAPRRGSGAADDENGHGTHVAGIVAGEWCSLEGPDDPVRIRGIAPRALLHVYRTLGADGGGDDASVLMALDDIAARNEERGGPFIHGVNLSLGGRFDPASFGCGFSPLCTELRRLIRQGVVVVVAAGNEGFQVLQGDRSPVEVNVPISIGDPANLDEAIAVGSTHKDRPHLYGVSFFSSRGPTADGRPKPDVVAPGEKVVSCRARRDRSPQTSFDALYVAMSGTSMAAAEVSGLLAAFLSARPGLAGFPDRVKQVLLANCTSLGRVPEQQGAGLPNLARMLLNS